MAGIARIFLCILVPAFLSVFLAACFPTSENPVGKMQSTARQADGEPTHAASRLLGSWKGVLGTDAQAVYLFFLAGDDNKLEALLIRPGDGQDKGGWLSFALILGELGEHRFVNAKILLDDGEPSAEKDNGYTPLLYRFDKDDTLRFFVLDDIELKKVIREGKIAGEVKEGTYFDDIRITADAKTLDAFFLASAASLFTEDFGTFHRLN